jgi:hypothetical protein
VNPGAASGGGAWRRRDTIILQLQKSAWHCSGGAEGVPCKFQIVLELLLLF